MLTLDLNNHGEEYKHDFEIQDESFLLDDFEDFYDDKLDDFTDSLEALCDSILDVQDLHPDKKLEKAHTDKKYGNKVLKKHRLTTIVKLPENLFFGVGVTTSIFIFEAGKPQNGQNVIGYYIEKDGLETVKNQGRQDIKNAWPELEDYWVKSIRDGYEPTFGTRQIINPSEHLSYQMPEKPFEIFEEDFMKTMIDYEMFNLGIDVKDFSERILQKVLYSSEIKNVEGQKISIEIKKEL